LEKKICISKDNIGYDIVFNNFSKERKK